MISPNALEKRLNEGFDFGPFEELFDRVKELIPDAKEIKLSAFSNQRAIEIDVEFENGKRWPLAIGDIIV
jgi:hypothetical protein